MDAGEPLIRTVLLVLLLYAAGCLASTGREVHAAEAQARELRSRLETAERELTAAEDRLAGALSPEELEQLARERLGLVLPGDRVFRFPPGPREAPQDRNTRPGRSTENLETERLIHGLADRRNS